MRRWVPFVSSAPKVAVIRLSGMIGGGRAGNALNDAGLANLIERAFKRRKPRAVALVVNSPGGSPVQSSLISARIRRLADERGIPVHAFVEDLAASGGYWLAAEADDIWLDPMSVVGSIGVISASFGAHELIQRYGIERRVYTAGRSKSMLDPFRPEKDEDVARIQSLLDQVHGSFIDHVKHRRGGKLDQTSDLFNGDIWVGSSAITVGLADGIGHLVPKMKEIYGDDVVLMPYLQKRGLLQRFSVGITDSALTALEERAHFARFGV